MRIYENRFHNRHSYLEIEESEVAELTPELFDTIRKEQGKPLQVMLSSDNRRLIALLVRSGFQCKRRCYEMEARAEDRLVLRSDRLQAEPILHSATRAQSEWKRCAQLIFQSYVAAHSAVNPLTASREEFFDILPDAVIFAVQPEGEIAHAAFIEADDILEIAYVGTSKLKEFTHFCDALLDRLFSHHRCIVLEADDTDRAATMLRRRFRHRDRPTFDTYVKA